VLNLHVEDSLSARKLRPASFPQTHMASKYLRRSIWWIQFYHPVTRALIRESLDTADEYRAELIRERVDHEVALLDPRYRAVELPPQVRQIVLGGVRGENPPAVVPEAGASRQPQPGSMPAPAAPRRQRSIDEALGAYINFIRIENAPHHVANKLSILRRFFGNARMSGAGAEPKIQHANGSATHQQKAFFTGDMVHEIEPAIVQTFIEGLPVSTKTKRHYREVFHHFFEFCLKFGFYESLNAHCPNPVGALPGYVSRNRRIVFLTPAQVDEQLHVLRGSPTLQIAVAIMIHAGLRRAETMWLTRDAISKDLSFLSIVNRVDDDRDVESSLKTGDRAVTILPPLKALLENYLPRLRGKWLVPSSKGAQWGGNEFAKKLRTLNRAAKLAWTCLHYRHTYATQRAAEGWPLFRIAREMGNSVSVVEEYYAGFIGPHSIITAA